MKSRTKNYVRVHLIPNSYHYAAVAQWARRSCLACSGAVINVRVIDGVGWRYAAMRYCRYVCNPEVSWQTLSQILERRYE